MSTRENIVAMVLQQHCCHNYNHARQRLHNPRNTALQTTLLGMAHVSIPIGALLDASGSSFNLVLALCCSTCVSWDFAVRRCSTSTTTTTCVKLWYVSLLLFWYYIHRYRTIHAPRWPISACPLMCYFQMPDCPEGTQRGLSCYFY